MPDQIAWCTVPSSTCIVCAYVCVCEREVLMCIYLFEIVFRNLDLCRYQNKHTRMGQLKEKKRFVV